MSVRIENGRAKSTRSREEEEELLAEELASCSPEERAVLEQILGGVTNPANTEAQDLYKTLSNLEWTSTPVDMHTFIRDPYYLGNTCDNLYPQLEADLTALFGGGYREAIFTGAIGWGKTFSASIGVCRTLYELSCMRDPHRSFGIAANSNISLVCLSVNEVLATKVAYENIATKIEASPYFQEYFPFEKTKKELRFPKHVWVAARATTDNSVLGLNVIGGLLDETNFMRAQKSKDPRFSLESQAQNLYNAMMRRMKSRFERKGKLPGCLFVVSSKQTHDDFTAKRVVAAKNDPLVFARDYALWDVKPDAYFSGEWFSVVVGNEQSPSRILRHDEDPVEVQKHLQEGCLLIPVPEDFRNDFERDLEGAIRDLAGIATVSVSPFIQRREKIVEAIDKTREHPFSSLIYDPSTSAAFLWHKMVQPSADAVLDYSLEDTSFERPILNPRAPRHIHIDPSLRGDATGICMAHVGGWKDVPRRDSDGTRYTERAPIIVVDFVLRIVPPVGDELVLGDIRKFIYQLSRRGYMITRITQDSWQSAEGIQKLNQKGYTAEVLSVDKSMAPYEMLKSALYENRISYYDYPPLMHELRELEHDRIKKKIDHPSRGSKDVADALAACVYTLVENSSAMPIPMLKSIPNYGGDVWLEEQHHLALASSHGSNASRNPVLDNFSVLPPFLIGSYGSGDDD